MNLRMHPTLRLKCHHQIMYSKLSLEKEYPPPCAREVWDYGKAQFDLTNVAVGNFDWNKLFSGHNILSQIKLFYRANLSIFRNFIPNMVIPCDDKEPP